MIDSGCTKHMTYERSIIKEFIPMKNKKELGMLIVFLQQKKALLQLKQIHTQKNIDVLYVLNIYIILFSVCMLIS